MTITRDDLPEEARKELWRLSNELRDVRMGQRHLEHAVRILRGLEDDSGKIGYVQEKGLENLIRVARRGIQSARESAEAELVWVRQKADAAQRRFDGMLRVD